jgi:hypothetical protein
VRIGPTKKQKEKSSSKNKEKTLNNNLGYIVFLCKLEGHTQATEQHGYQRASMRKICHAYHRLPALLYLLLQFLECFGYGRKWSLHICFLHLGSSFFSKFFFFFFFFVSSLLAGFLSPPPKEKPPLRNPRKPAQLVLTDLISYV